MHLKSLIFWTAPMMIVFVSCAGSARHPATSVSVVGAFTVDPEFIGGPSILTAARRASPGSDRISLSGPVLGSDARFDYVTFFVGRNTHGGFESIYYRYWVFAKRKSALDWSSARVFDWPRDYMDPFTGPIERLEKDGRELPEEPNQSLEPTPKAVTHPAGAGCAPALGVAHH